MGVSIQNLIQYQLEGNSFIESIITGDETQGFEFTPETKQQSMIWKHPASPIKKKIQYSTTCP